MYRSSGKTYILCAGQRKRERFIDYPNAIATVVKNFDIKFPLTFSQWDKLNAIEIYAFDAFAGNGVDCIIDSVGFGNIFKKKIPMMIIKTVNEKKKAQPDSISASEPSVSQVFEFRDDWNSYNNSIDSAAVVALRGNSVIRSGSYCANIASINKKKSNHSRSQGSRYSTD